VSDPRLNTPSVQIVSYMYIMAITSCIWWNDNDVGFVLDQLA